MSITSVPSAAELVEEARALFSKQFGGREAAAVGVAPGRVNLIGEHTDYNDGFVFPMALSLVTVVAGSLNTDGSNLCRVYTAATDVIGDDSALLEFRAPTTAAPLTPGSPPCWGNYVKGVIANFHASVSGFCAVVVSAVPRGGGLSSSASLEVAVYTFLEALLNTSAKSMRDKAEACQRAEHDFAGVPCGIMDQLVAVAAEAGTALLIDCRSVSWEAVPVPGDGADLVVVVCNSNVRHTLASTEYALRRADCHSAARALSKHSLRDVTMEQLEGPGSEVVGVVRQRARHVVAEIARTQQAVAALKAGEYEVFGRLMTESHHSLSGDYGVSCAELDALVAAALEVPGVLGSRMTGGGFGGCTVTLVRRDSVDALVRHVTGSYDGRVTFYIATPAAGAYALTF